MITRWQFFLNKPLTIAGSKSVFLKNHHLKLVQLSLVLRNLVDSVSFFLFGDNTKTKRMAYLSFMS